MKISREHIVRALQRIAAPGGKAPGRRVFESQTGIRPTDWEGVYWAKWNDLVAEAGLAANAMQEALDENDVLARLAALVVERGKFPTVSEMRLERKKDSTFPAVGVFNRFGDQVARAERLRAWATENGRKDVVEILGPPTCTESDGADELATASSGTVYMLRSAGRYKIGMSRDVERRFRELGYQSPHQVDIVHSFETDDPIGIEKYWHNRFAEKKRYGEWFDLDTADVRAFKRRKKFM